VLCPGDTGSHVQQEFGYAPGRSRDEAGGRPADASGKRVIGGTGQRVVDLDR